MEKVGSGGGSSMENSVESLPLFNTIQTMMQMDPEGADDMNALVNTINWIIGDMNSFKPYFIHVRFPDHLISNDKYKSIDDMNLFLVG